MNRLLSGMVVLAVLAASAAAEPRHDLRLEQAAMEIVAEKMGDIRGGFSMRRSRCSSPADAVNTSVAAGNRRHKVARPTGSGGRRQGCRPKF